MTFPRLAKRTKWRTSRTLLLAAELLQKLELGSTMGIKPEGLILTITQPKQAPEGLATYRHKQAPARSKTINTNLGFPEIEV